MSRKTMTAKATQIRSRTRGLGSLELAISAFALVVMVCLCLDVGVMMLGNQVVDRAARDAARAAASQSDSASALNAAKAALASHKTDGTYITQPVLTGTSSPDFVYQDYGGAPFGQTVPPPGSGVAGNPFVVVNVKADVKLPAAVDCLGQFIQQGPLTGGKMTFQRQYQFPIVKQKLDSSFQ